MFIGFVQRTDKFEEMEPVKGDYENFEKHYIITDSDCNITNVSEGLKDEIGLHAKFFKYNDSIFQRFFNISTICPDLIDPDIQEVLTQEGLIVSFDTRRILDNLELE